MTVELPPVPPPYRAPTAGPSEPSDAPDPPPPPDQDGAGRVPARLARLADRHPLVIAVAIVSVAVTLATSGATVIAFAARWWWVFDILTSYRPQFALVLVVGVVCLALLRYWKILAVAVVALLLNLTQLAPVFLGHQPAARAGSPTLTIAHLNLQSRAEDQAATDQWLATHPADIIVFLHTVESTADHLEPGIHGYRMIYPRVGTGGFHGGNHYIPRSSEVVVLTDRAGVTARTPTLHGLPSAAVEIETSLGGRAVSLLGLHTLSPGTAERQTVRNGELAAVADWLRAASRPAVAFGDFNTTYYSPEMSDLLHRAHATSSQIGFGIQATWPRQFRPAGIAIDQSVYTGDLTAVDRYRGPNLGSEHRVLIVTYALAR